MLISPSRKSHRNSTLGIEWARSLFKREPGRKNNLRRKISICFGALHDDSTRKGRTTFERIFNFRCVTFECKSFLRLSAFYLGNLISKNVKKCAKKFSSLLVLTTKFSRHAFFSILSFGRAGYSFRL